MVRSSVLNTSTPLDCCNTFIIHVAEPHQALATNAQLTSETDIALSTRRNHRAQVAQSSVFIIKILVFPLKAMHNDESVHLRAPT